MKFYPTKMARKIGARSFDVPLNWTTREVDDAYAKMFLPPGRDTTDPTSK